MEKTAFLSRTQINPISIILLSLTVILLLYPKKIFAEGMQGKNYQLQLQQVYEKEPTPTPAPPSTKMTPTPRPPAVITMGRSSIALSDDTIDFGPLSPTDPVIRQLSFSIEGDNFPFFLYQQVRRGLQNQSGEEIPPTSCDNGSCSLQQASLWNSTLTYGIGVRCDNLQESVCPADFTPANVFRALGENSEEKNTILAEGTVYKKAVFNLSYKLIAPGTQAPGSYTGSLQYILIPEI